MVNVIVELSKFVILTLMVVYTFHCFYTVSYTHLTLPTILLV